MPLFSGQAIAAPYGLPQNMVPAYMPASPSQGVARFRPHYRMQQPVRYLPPRYVAQRGMAPVQYRPVRRAVAWPLPVSYRPIAQAPRSPMGAQFYPRMRQAAHPYPVAMPGYQGRPMPRMAYDYPYAQRPMPRRGAPPAHRGFSGHRYPAPANYRPPNAWIPPVRSAMRPPVYGYPQLQRPSQLVQQSMPGRVARYQPYNNRNGSHQNYRFRSVPPTMAYQSPPVLLPNNPRQGYPMNYRYRPDLRYPYAISGQRAYPFRSAPVYYPERITARQNNALAWSDAPYQARY